MIPAIYGHIPGPLWTQSQVRYAKDILPLESRVEELEHSLERERLTMEALWTLLRDKTGLTEEQLVARVQEIDLSDGQLDGKVRRPAQKCKQCGRTLSRRFDACPYCGAKADRDPFA